MQQPEDAVRTLSAQHGSHSARASPGDRLRGRTTRAAVIVVARDSAPNSLSRG
ncbi:hypothetical protein OG241_00640 [Streptomyces sp. NBC_01390]|uniref:hypothetical protein n=1 Tax=Streptomyces sp. NBC_01390 TaxID=2903850 RepID=UPI00324D341C